MLSSSVSETQDCDKRFHNLVSGDFSFMVLLLRHLCMPHIILPCFRKNACHTIGRKSLYIGNLKRIVSLTMYNWPEPKLILLGYNYNDRRGDIPLDDPCWLAVVSISDDISFELQFLTKAINYFLIWEESLESQEIIAAWSWNEWMMACGNVALAFLLKTSCRLI